MHELHFSPCALFALQPLQKQKNPTQRTHSTNFAPLVMVAAISSLACGDNNA